MKLLLLCLSVCLSVFAHGTTIEDFLKTNLGDQMGTQEKDGKTCEFHLRNTETPGGYLLVIYYQNPARGRGVGYYGVPGKFTLDADTGVLTYDKSDLGKPNLIYRFDPLNLDLLAVEEQGVDVCGF